MINKYSFLAAFLFPFFHCILGIRETCTSPGIPYSSGTQFLSVKQDGRKYTCVCFESNCQVIQCRRTSNPTAVTSGVFVGNDDDDEISNEPGQMFAHRGKPIVVSIQLNRTLPILSQGYPDEVNEPAFQTFCIDDSTGGRFQRGSRFNRNRPGSVRYDCVCPYNGPAVIQCKAAQCHLPDPPQRSEVAVSFNNNCYDPWLDAEVPRGVYYNRTRLMNERNGITGKYRCICNNYVIHCTAIDIPCCDQETAEFVGKNQRFITLKNNQILECICIGGMQLTSACVTVGRPQQCYDKFSNSYHDVHTTWKQIRPSSEWACRCLPARGNRMKTKCVIKKHLLGNRRH